MSASQRQIVVALAANYSTAAHNEGRNCGAVQERRVTAHANEARGALNLRLVVACLFPGNILIMLQCKIIVTILRTRKTSMFALPIFRKFAVSLLLTAMPSAAFATDTLELAVGAPNNWDTCIPEVGQRPGIFAKHGLKLDILYTQGGGETMQAVISGSVDVGIAAGAQAVMGTDSKGAPVQILAAGTTGAGDLFRATISALTVSAHGVPARTKPISDLW